MVAISGEGGLVLNALKIYLKAEENVEYLLNVANKKLGSDC